MKVLVTGASGFIGNYVIQELLKNNHTVIASSTSIEKIDQRDWLNRVIYVPFNLKDEFKSTSNLFNIFHQPDACIHLAWEGLPNYNEKFHIIDNLPRHRLFVENLISNGLKNFTGIGTCFEYGMQEGCLEETMVASPQNSYAIAKNELRKSIEEFAEINNCNFKWARLFYMYGKGQSEKSILSQLKKAISQNEPTFNMSGGQQIRDYLPIEQVAEYIVMLALQIQITGIVNICSNKPIKIIDFINQYLQKNNASIKLNLGYYPYPDYEPMAFWGGNKKLNFIK